MIKVTFTEEGKKLSLRLEGHAGYAEGGKDIICSSASILAYTLASIVNTFHEVESNIDLTSGNATIECECKDEVTYSNVAYAYLFAKMGYALLEHNYPQYVRIIP